MLTPRELSYGLYGAWRLVRLDSGAMRFFDASPQGFWKSFQVAFLVLPAVLAVTMMRFAISGMPERAGLVEIAIVEASAYVMTWVAFPLAMSPVCDLLQRGERYIGYIVALNWAKVPVVAIDLTAFLFVVLSGADPMQPNPLTTIAFFAISFYLWFVAKTALQISGWAAGAVVILMFTIDGMIQFTAIGLLR